MTHAEPEPSLSKMDPMNNWTYWVLLADRAVRAAAGGALSVLVAGHTDWKTMAIGAGVGALTAALTDLGSEAVPGTLPQSYVPSTPQTRRMAVALVRRPQS